jgi:hypothetical protein
LNIIKKAIRKIIVWTSRSYPLEKTTARWYDSDLIYFTHMLLLDDEDDGDGNGSQEVNEEGDEHDEGDEKDEGDEEEEAGEVEYDSEENEVEVASSAVAKAGEFLDAEAELSEEEWSSEDEDERGLDTLEMEEADREKIDQRRLKHQLDKIHMYVA